MFTRLVQSFSGIPIPIWILSAISLVNRMGAMVITFMTLYLTQALHYDIRTAGYILLSFGIGSVVGQFIGGQLIDKLGFFRVMQYSLLSNGVVLLVVLMVQDFWVLTAVMFFLALSSESFRPANTIAIKEFSDAETRTRSYSLMRVSVNMAIGVALVVGGALVAFGWHWLFWVDSVTCFLAALILVFFEKKHPKAPPQYKTEILANSTENESKITELSPYRDRDYLIFTFMTFIGAVVFMQIMWTIPVFFKEVYGWSEFKIGCFSAINTVAVMVIEMPLIFRIEKKRPPMWFVQFGILLYAISYAAFLLPTIWAVGIAIFYMIIVSFGEIFVMPFSTSWASQRADGPKQGQYMALYGIAYSVTNAASPFLGTQIIAAFGYSALWMVSVALCVVAWLGFGYLGRRK